MEDASTQLTLCYKAEIKEYPNGTRTNMDIKAYQKAYREKHKKKPVYTFSVIRRPPHLPAEPLPEHSAE